MKSLKSLSEVKWPPDELSEGEFHGFCSKEAESCYTVVPVRDLDAFVEAHLP